MRDWKKSQRMIELLQTKLRDAMDGGDRRSSISPNEEDGLRTVAGTDTSTMVKKDRENHRFKLHLLDGMSRSQSIELLKDVCRTFGIQGDGVLFKLLPTIERIQQVVLAVPRMQSFVRNVCYILRVDPSTSLGVAMEMGIKTMKEWEKGMERKREMERLREALVMVLVTNREGRLQTEGGTLINHFDDVRILAEMKSLVEEEKKTEKEEKYYEEIEIILKSNPMEMTTRMVRHFQQLFDVDGVRGVMPKMNELFLFSSEMKTFLDAARSRLRLSPHATTAAVMMSLEEITKEGEGGEEEKKEEGEGGGGGGEGKKEGMSNLMEEKRTKGGTAFSVTRKGVPGWTVEK